MTDPFPPKDLYCHRTGFQKKCLALVSSKRCNRWWQLEGNHPVTGEVIKQYDCIDNWPVLLLLDLAKKVANGTTGTQAAVESFRNEMVEMQSGRVQPDQQSGRVNHTKRITSQ